MKNEELHVFLANINLSSIEMPVYQSCLRKALLLHGENQQTLRTSFWADCKNLLERAVKTRRITLIGSGAVLAVAAVLGLVLLTSQNTPDARAEGLVNHSIKTMQSVPPEVRAEFEKAFGRDPFDFLDEAKQAKDLATLTQVELEAELLQKFGIGEMFMGGNGMILRQIRASKGLGYTDPSGNSVLLGLDDNDALIFAAGPSSVFEVHGG